MSKGKPNCYALYKGDEFLALGTIKEIAKQRGVKVNAVERLNCPSVVNKRENKDERLILIKVED